MPVIKVQVAIGLPNQMWFNKWVPSEGVDDIICCEEGFEVRIWVGKDYNDLIKYDDHNIQNVINVGVERLHASIGNVCISDNLGIYIRNHRSHYETGRAIPEVEVEYLDIGKKLQHIITNRVNRLIGYAYAVKGQSDLIELKRHPENAYSFFLEYDGTAFFEDGTSYRFEPWGAEYINISIVEERTCITHEEWGDVRAFVAGGARTPLVGHLLSNSESLLDKGHSRSAIIEAVSALETALNEFSHEWSDTPCEKWATRGSDVQGIKALYTKVGLRGAFSFLIPMMLKECQMPSKTIAACREAIDMRNNLIHNGTRDADIKKVEGMIWHIRDCCSRFDVIVKAARKNA